jgi:hypothetical protein
MTYRACLCRPDGKLDADVFDLLTDAQQAKLCRWSIQLDKPVFDLLTEARFMVSQFSSADDRLMTLEGILPHCGMYGAMLPDGSCRAIS